MSTQIDVIIEDLKTARLYALYKWVEAKNWGFADVDCHLKAIHKFDNALFIANNYVSCSYNYNYIICKLDVITNEYMTYCPDKLNRQQVLNLLSEELYAKCADITIANDTSPTVATATDGDMSLTWSKTNCAFTPTITLKYSTWAPINTGTAAVQFASVSTALESRQRFDGSIELKGTVTATVNFNTNAPSANTYYTIGALTKYPTIEHELLGKPFKAANGATVLPTFKFKTNGDVQAKFEAISGTYPTAADETGKVIGMFSGTILT